jgi:hypothetical protein
MVIDMKFQIESARALLYETGRSVDMAIHFEKLSENPPADKVKARENKQQQKKYKRLAGMLTPMSKYYCSEMCNSVGYDSIQVLGGSGFMRDYPCERFARDARITTIYEGTSQLQVVAAVRGVCGGTCEKYLTELAEKKYDDSVAELLDILKADAAKLKEAAVYAKGEGIDYMDLYGRGLVDVAINLIIGYMFCGQASSDVDMDVAIAGNGEQKTIKMTERKKIMAGRFIRRNQPKHEAIVKNVCAGDKSTFSDYEALIGPVPEEV